MRRLLYNSKGTRQERFGLVELPKVLYVGFYWTLKDLQNKSASDENLAFIKSIAPSTAGSSPEVSIPGTYISGQTLFICSQVGVMPHISGRRKLHYSPTIVLLLG